VKERLPDLSTDARALLEAGRAAEPLPPDVAARVWGKVATGMPLAPVALPPAPATTFTLAKLVAVSLGILGVGAVATVAVVHFRPRPHSPAILAPQPKQVEELPPVAPPIPAMLPPVPDASPPTARAAPAVSAHAPSKSILAPRFSDAPEGDLAAERSLIARARTLLERGLPLDALATLRLHEQRFKRGALAQQREALRIQALIASGNRPGAEAAAARFEHDYPQSLMGPAVRAALGTKR